MNCRHPRKEYGPGRIWCLCLVCGASYGDVPEEAGAPFEVEPGPQAVLTMIVETVA